MPYSGKDDPDLPANVQALSDDERAQWVEIWNSAYESCLDDGGKTDECESSAFAQANGVVLKTDGGQRMQSNSDVDSFVERLMAEIKSGLANLFKPRKIKEVDSWDGAASNYESTESYCKACLINVNPAAGKTDPDEWVQANCKLPVREDGDPADTYVDKAVFAAQGGRGITNLTKPEGVSDEDWNQAVESAAKELIKANEAMDKQAPDAVYELAGETPPEKKEQSMSMTDTLKRAMSLMDMYYQIDDQVWKSDVVEYGFVNDLFIDNGTIFAIVSASGKLWKVPVTVTGNDVQLGEFQAVEIDFKPVENARRTRTTVYRTTDGRYRWVSISCTSVLNRVGEIDSTRLFDSFVSHAKETGEYPYRTFFHQGEAFRTGECDFMARDGNVLITSGLFDDTEIGRAEAEARLADPDYWGESIGYVPTSDPELIEIAGVKIPVYNEGVLREISNLPEHMAAAWFTAHTTLLEVNRMLEGKMLDEFVKLFGGDEERALAWLQENAERTNRTIEEENLLRRARAAQEPAAQEPAANATDPSETETETETETPDQTVIEFSEEDFQFMAQRILATDRMQELSTTLRTINDSLQAVETGLDDLQGELKTISDRLELLERDEDEKRQAWLNDLPSGRHIITATFRPREKRQPEGEEAEEPEPAEKQAQQVLQKLPSYGSV